MPKKRNFDMSEIEFTFDKTQILAWQTRYLDYEFANQLNLLYDLQLAREINFDYVTEKNVKLSCVNYLYYDEIRQLMYILVQNDVDGDPIAQGTELYDKVMFIYGRDSKDCCMKMFEEFRDGVEVQGDWDLLGKMHADKMQEVKEHGVLYEDYFDFSDKEHWATSVMHTGNPTTDKKIDKRLKGIHDGIEDLLIALEIKISAEEVSLNKDEDDVEALRNPKWILG